MKCMENSRQKNFFLNIHCWFLGACSLLKGANVSKVFELGKKLQKVFFVFFKFNVVIKGTNIDIFHFMY